MKAKPEDREVLADIDEIFKQDFDSSQIIRERSWFRNILFYLGEQWISWFEEIGTFGARFAFNPNEPMPVSNIIRDHVRSMKALILNKKYATRVWPNSEEQKDKDAAELGVMILKWLDSLLCNEVEDIKEFIALWVCLSGNGFARTYADMDTGVYVTGADEKIIPRGDIAVECIIPFNVVVPILGSTLRRKSYVGIKGLKEKEWVEDTFKVIVPGADSSEMIEYEKQLMVLVANVSPWKGRGLDVGIESTLKTSEYILFKEVEYRPTNTYPKGRYVASAGGVICKNEIEMPIKVSSDGDWEYTITDFKYNHTPGSFWATPSVDDLIGPQKTINEVDKALASNRKDVGRPYVLTPQDLVLTRLSKAGSSFLQMKYDPMSSAGLKPEVHPGTPYPQQILEERKINVNVAQDASGDPKNILRGQSPHSGASGVMVDILRESAEMSHTPDIERFYRSWNRVKCKQLIVARDLFTETRLLKVAGEGNNVIVKAFKGADLFNNTDVRLELDSGVSSTRAGQNEFVMKLIQNKFFGDVSANPKMQYEIMRRFGMSWIPVERSIHEEEANRENGMIANASDTDIHVDFSITNPAKIDPKTGKPTPVSIPVLDGIFYARFDPAVGEPVVLSHDPYYKYGDHRIHFDSHVKIILSKEFKAWPKANQTVLINHTDIHKMELDAQEQKAMENMQQMAQLKGEAIKKLPEPPRTGTVARDVEPGPLPMG